MIGPAKSQFWLFRPIFCFALGYVTYMSRVYFIFITLGLKVFEIESFKDEWRTHLILIVTTPDQYYGSRLAYVVPITDDTRYRGCLAHGGYKKISKYFQSPEGTTKNCRSALKLCNYFFYINTHILSAGPCNISTTFTVCIRLIYR